VSLSRVVFAWLYLFVTYCIHMKAPRNITIVGNKIFKHNGFVMYYEAKITRIGKSTKNQGYKIKKLR
jgi:hypothetical protein